MYTEKIVNSASKWGISDAFEDTAIRFVVVSFYGELPE